LGSGPPPPPPQVLQRILEPLLVLMVEKSVLTWLSNHLRLHQQLMEQEPSMLVLADHQLLMLVLGQSINNNKLLVEEKATGRETSSISSNDSKKWIIL
jgi:hypothetical protein